MIRWASLLALLGGLSGCDRTATEPSLPPRVTARPATPAAAPPRTLVRTETAPVPNSPPEPAQVPYPRPTAPPRASTRAPFIPPPFIPSREEPTHSTPAFTFRTMDHRKAYVLTNGQRYSDTTCLFALTPSTQLDPKIEVPEWPPAGAHWIGKLSGRSDRDGKLSTIEVAIQGGAFDQAGKDRIKSKYPHVDPGEQLLYVKADICGSLRQGAIRLKLIGTDGTIYRYVDYSPLQNLEEEDASKFARSIWFEAEAGD